jgi:hypothetical protein
MKKLKLLLLSFLFLIVSCNATKTALYDQYSYQKTTELKVASSQLMDKATTPFSFHKEEVDKLLLEIDQLAEYEKNKPNNEITFAMWKILSDKEKNLLAGFFKRWEQKGTFSQIFLNESKKQIMEAIDLLIQYEINKDTVSKEGLLNIISKS